MLLVVALFSLFSLCYAEHNWNVSCSALTHVNVPLDQLSGKWQMLEAYVPTENVTRTLQLCGMSEFQDVSRAGNTVLWTLRYLFTNFNQTYVENGTLRAEYRKWTVHNGTRDMPEHVRVLLSDVSRHLVWATCISEKDNSRVANVHILARHGEHLTKEEISNIRNNIAQLMGLQHLFPLIYDTKSC